MSFDPRDYIKQLTPHPKHKSDYLCPACGVGKLTIGKSGAYKCWAGCETADIREALSPSCNPNAGRTQEEIEQRKQAAAEARAQQDRERERRYSRAAARAEQEWAAAVPLTEADPALVETCYWTRKGLKAIADVRIVLGDYRQGKAEVPRGTVLFAVRNKDGVIRSLQRVHPDGEKHNLAGGEMAHGTAALGDLASAEVVAIAEGPATAGSIHEATGWPVLIGFSTSGLPHAAAIARELAPTAQLVFCADNDLTEAGLKAAEPLARKYSGVIAMPPTVETDWNDHHLAEGLQAVTDALTAALEAGPVPAAEAEDAAPAAEPQAEAQADQDDAPAEAGEAEELDLDEALEQLQELKQQSAMGAMLQLARRMLKATVGLDRTDAEGWLKSISKLTGQRVQVLRTAWQELVNEQARARAAEQQAKLEAAQQQALEAGTLDPRLADQFLLLRLRDTNDGLDLFESDASLTLGADADLQLVTLQGRAVHLCWDRDIFDPKVKQQLRDKAIALRQAGADVRIEVLPRCPEDGRVLTAVEVADRYGRDFLLSLAKAARNCWTKDGGFHVSPDAESTVQRALYVTGMIGDRMVADPSLTYAWSVYTGTHWQEHPNDKLIRRKIHTLAEAQGWVKGREFGAFNSLIADITRGLTRALPGCPAGLVPLENGMLELRTRQLLPHSPEYGNRYCLPYAYDPNATAEPIIEFLAERLGGPERLRLFQAWLTLVLRGVRPKQFVELVGDSNTGKSTISNLVEALLGDENIVSTDLQRLEDKTNRFETCKLRGKRLVIIPEAHKYSGSLEVLKALTGGDLISAEIKGSTGSADFYFEGGVLVVGNGFLYASDSSDAVMKRRMPFTLGRVKGPLRVLLERDESSGAWKGEFVPMLPGLFNWALDMDVSEARQVLEGRQQVPALREQDYLNLIEQDPLLAWADANLVLAADPSSYLRVGTANDSADSFAFPNYRRHCEEQGVRNPLSFRSFRKTLVSRLISCGMDLPSEGDPAYRIRGMGAAIPGIALRWPKDTTTPSLLQVVMLSDPAGTVSGTVGNGSGTVETPVGNEWNGWNGLSTLTRMGVENDQTPETEEQSGNDVDPDVELKTLSIGVELQKNVPTVPPSPSKGFNRSANRSATVPNRSETSDPGVLGSNPYDLNPDQVAIARQVVAENPGISDGALEMKLRGRGLQVPLAQVEPLRQWLVGGAA